MLLTSIPSPEISFFEIGPLRIHIYALCIIAGITVAGIVTGARLNRRGAERGVVIDFLVWGVVFGIIGARLYHVLSHWGDFFGDGATQQWYAIWNGGIAIFGALTGGAIGVLIASRLTGVRFFSLADALVPGLLLAQALGRLGNWFNQELFGEPTTLPWGLEISAGNPAYPIGLPAGTLFHPTFMYEILWNLTGVVVLLWIERKMRPRWGKFFALYLIWYGIGRFWIEGLRLDPSLTFFGLRTNELTALLAIFVGIIIWIMQTKRHPGLEISVYLPGRERPGLSTLKQTADPEKYHHVLDHGETPAAGTTGSVAPSAATDSAAPSMGGTASTEAKG